MVRSHVDATRRSAPPRRLCLALLAAAALVGPGGRAARMGHSLGLEDGVQFFDSSYLAKQIELAQQAGEPTSLAAHALVHFSYETCPQAERKEPVPASPVDFVMADYFRREVLGPVERYVKALAFICDFEEGEEAGDLRVHPRCADPELRSTIVNTRQGLELWDKIREDWVRWAEMKQIVEEDVVVVDPPVLPEVQGVPRWPSVHRHRGHAVEESPAPRSDDPPPTPPSRWRSLLVSVLMLDPTSRLAYFERRGLVAEAPPTLCAQALTLSLPSVPRVAPAASSVPWRTPLAPVARQTTRGGYALQEAFGAEQTVAEVGSTLRAAPQAGQDCDQDTDDATGPRTLGKESATTHVQASVEVAHSQSTEQSAAGQRFPHVHRQAPSSQSALRVGSAESVLKQAVVFDSEIVGDSTERGRSWQQGDEVEVVDTTVVVTHLTDDCSLASLAREVVAEATISAEVRNLIKTAKRFSSGEARSMQELPVWSTASGDVTEHADGRPDAARVTAEDFVKLMDTSRVFTGAAQRLHQWASTNAGSLKTDALAVSRGGEASIDIELGHEEEDFMLSSPETPHGLLQDIVRGAEAMVKLALLWDRLPRQICLSMRDGLHQMRHDAAYIQRLLQSLAE